MSEAISPRDKGAEGKVDIVREEMHSWSNPVRGEITYWILLKVDY